jgi:phosphoserine phosphatase
MRLPPCLNIEKVIQAIETTQQKSSHMKKPPFIQMLLVRHGETDYNTADRLQGQRDIPLNPNGVRQAQTVAMQLASTIIDRAYVSPLTRARQTAAYLIGDRQISSHIVPNLQEIHHGDWEGRTNAELKADYPYEFDLWQNNPLACRKPNGETIEQLAQRAVQSWQEIVRQSTLANCQTVLVVTHKVTIQTILCHIHGLELEHFWDFPQDNCAISIIDYRNGSPRLRNTNLNLWKPDLARI